MFSFFKKKPVETPAAEPNKLDPTPVNPVASSIETPATSKVDSKIQESAAAEPTPNPEKLSWFKRLKQGVLGIKNHEVHILVQRQIGPQLLTRNTFAFRIHAMGIGPAA